MFWIVKDQPIQCGRLIYRPRDYSFDYEPVPYGRASCETTLCWGFLQLCVTLDGDVLDVWGYWPHPAWRLIPLVAPEGSRGQLWFKSERPLYAGISQGINEPGMPPTWVDR